MAELPNASVAIDDQAGAFAGSTGYIFVPAAVAQNADCVPRVYSSAKGILTQHGYSQGGDYAAIHIGETKKPVIFAGMPIATPGAVTYLDNTGVTGTSRVSVSVGSDGALEELDGVATVVIGGTIGVNGIVVEISPDNNRTKKRVRLGTATSYTLPYFGATVNFGSGTLNAGDVVYFRTSAPMWDQTGIQSVREKLALQQKPTRSWLVAGDVPSTTVAGYVLTEINAYHSTNERDNLARINTKDERRFPKKSKVAKKMTGSPSITFAEVGVSGDTITRATGSFTDDGFAVGDTIKVLGAVNSGNNLVSAVIASLSATVITLGTDDLVAEVAATGISIVASETLTFAEVGASGDTITRSSGSWITEGFAVGDPIVITGTSLNNISATIASLSATVITLGTEDLAAEVIASRLVTLQKVQATAASVAAIDAAYSVAIDGENRIDISLGKAKKASPITGAILRRPASWAASVREYQHDIHIPNWRKADGPLSGWSMRDEDGNLDEFDETNDGGALAGRFTCFRSWSNGPNGTFIALSLTRGSEGSLLSRTHNMYVANLACNICRAETEMAIGQVLVLNDDGTATQSSLSSIESRVNTALENNLLTDKEGEGQRASKAVWRASKTDNFNVPGATLNGVLELLINGTIEKIATRVRVLTGGAQ
jgi:hypothetical protein